MRRKASFTETGFRLARAALCLAIAGAAPAWAGQATPAPGGAKKEAQSAPAPPRTPLPPDLIQPLTPPSAPAAAADKLKSGAKPSAKEAAAVREKCERAAYVVRQANDFRDESPLTASYYKRALAMCPGHPEANFRLGVLMYHKKDFEEARKLFERTIRSDPKFVEAYFNLGIMNRLLKKVAKAEKWFRRAVRADPRHAPTLYNLGVLQVRALNRLEALKNFRRAVRSDPKMAEAHFFIGALLQEQGKRREAKAALEKAIALNPKMALPRVYLAAILESGGDPQKAQRELNRALELNPASVNVGYGYEEFYFREGTVNDIILYPSRRPASGDLPAVAASPRRVGRERAKKPPAPSAKKAAPPRGRQAREIPAPAGGPARKSAPAPAGRQAREITPEAGEPARPPARPPLPPEAPAPPKAAERTRSYRVRPGDTLSRIAQRYGTSLATLVRLNRDRIEHPSFLETGQLIRLPWKARPRARAKAKARRPRGRKKSARSTRRIRKKKAKAPAWRMYRVRPGDSLLRIARRFRTTTARLMRLNRDRIEHPSLLVTGDLIRVPRRAKRRPTRRKRKAPKKKK